MIENAKAETVCGSNNTVLSLLHVRSVRDGLFYLRERLGKCEKNFLHSFCGRKKNRA